MISCQEFMNNPKLEAVWIHSLDMLKHVLKGDTDQTIYKDKHPNRSHLKELTTELGEVPEIEEQMFNDCMDMFKPKKRYRRRYNDEGNFEVEQYLKQDERCFTEEYKEIYQERSITYVVDMCVPFADRDRKHMVRAHKELYQRTMEAMNNEIPVRVIVAFAVRYDEFEGVQRFYWVVKDYSDSIFPGIWGAFKDNRTTNSLINCIMDYLVGTECGNNGMPASWNVADDIDDNDRVVLLNPRYLKNER